MIKNTIRRAGLVILLVTSIFVIVCLVAVLPVALVSTNYSYTDTSIISNSNGKDNVISNNVPPALFSPNQMYQSIMRSQSWNGGEEKFLPTIASAFSCGYTAAADDDNTNPPILPNDIRKGFSNNMTVRQVWRLVKGYIRSAQKRREDANRQQDFDVSLLYVPFLPPKDVPLARVYSGETPRPDGTTESNLRVGVPMYQSGPAIWFL